MISSCTFKCYIIERAKTLTLNCGGYRIMFVKQVCKLTLLTSPQLSQSTMDGTMGKRIIINQY